MGIDKKNSSGPEAYLRWFDLYFILITVVYLLWRVAVLWERFR